MTRYISIINPKYIKNQVLNGGNEKPSKEPLNKHNIKALSFLFLGSIFNFIVNESYLSRQMEYAEHPSFLPINPKPSDVVDLIAI